MKAMNFYATFFNTFTRVVLTSFIDISPVFLLIRDTCFRKA